MAEMILLEAVLHGYSPRTAVMNPFKPKESRWLTALRAKASTHHDIIGKVQVNASRYAHESSTNMLCKYCSCFDGRHQHMQRIGCASTTFASEMIVICHYM